LVAGIVHDGVTTVRQIKHEMMTNNIRVRVV
jgi:imidazole glycerol phosphate synthase subunit HisF